ncbi:MAG TPA: response regulator [Flavitalea sp.]|nr:response regulator [Flavitalea sp.]
MAKSSPLILVEDDVEDQLLIREAVESIDPTRHLIIFDNGDAVIRYLLETTDKPFLIICDINMPKMDGLTVRKKINDNPILRNKSIPFVFFSTTASSDAVTTAYEMTVQGFFVKPSTFSELTKILTQLIDYWKVCKHPNMI